MEMRSLTTSLAKVGMKPPVALPSGFKLSPDSVKEIERLLGMPRFEAPAFSHESMWKFRFSKFGTRPATSDPQGLAHVSGDLWFISSKKGIFECRMPMGESVEVARWISAEQLAGQMGVSLERVDHIGDLHYRVTRSEDTGDGRHGMVFTAVESKDCKRTPLLVALSPHLDRVVGWAELTSSKDNHAAWCAASPWNPDVVYSSGSSGVDGFDAYDTSGMLDLLNGPTSKWGREIELPVVPRSFRLYDWDHSPLSLDSIQGVVFSRNGRIYVSRAEEKDVDWDNYLVVLDALTGLLVRQRAPLPVGNLPPEKWPEVSQRKLNLSGTFEEIEGLSVKDGMLFAAVCDNELGNHDWFYVERLSTSFPEDYPI